MNMCVRVWTVMDRSAVYESGVGCGLQGPLKTGGVFLETWLAARDWVRRSQEAVTGSMPKSLSTSRDFISQNVLISWF